VNKDRVSFEREIELRNIRFAYSTARVPVLDHFNLTIPRNSTIALVGSTGAGKTTIVDIILGLMKPQQGSLFVDGIPLVAAKVTAWQKQLGYVPQHIYLSDYSTTASRRILHSVCSPNKSKWIECGMHRESPIWTSLFVRSCLTGMTPWWVSVG